MCDRCLSTAIGQDVSEERGCVAPCNVMGMFVGKVWGRRLRGLVVSCYRRGKCSARAWIVEELSA